MKSSPKEILAFFGKTSWADFWRKGAVSFFFLGCSPKIPGTIGTLGGFFLVLLLPAEHFVYWAGGAAVALFVLGLSLAPWSIEYFRSKDPKPFVLDEVVGYLLAVFPFSPSWVLATLAFFLFRFFDVWKPFPVRNLEKLPGGYGIILDDVAAGLYVCMVLNLLRFFFPELAGYA